MQAYSVDIAPEQVVRWIMAERQAAPSRFTITAKRGAEVRQIPARREFRLGDEERDDLNEVATVATLEIAPVHSSDGWLLSVVVEDEVGPRVPDDGMVAEGEEEIELDAFFDEFVRPGRGTANVIAEVDGPAANQHMTRLLETIESNCHEPGVVVSKG